MRLIFTPKYREIIQALLCFRLTTTDLTVRSVAHHAFLVEAGVDLRANPHKNQTKSNFFGKA